MSARLQLRTLPIRRWLALALASVFVVPALALLIMGIIIFRETRGPQDATELAIARLDVDVARWHDPAWQAATQTELAARGVDFVLTEDDRELYRSAADPLAGSGDGETRLATQLLLSESAPRRVATIYADQQRGPPEEARFWLLPIAALSALLATLAGIAWFFGRAMVRPLSATSQAARRVASGDLAIALPASRIREVAEVNSAFEGMSAALGTSLRRQTQLEQERRLFIGAIVHDLRTPLFSLRGYLEGLERGLADTPEARARYIAVAQDKAAALERLISDLFAYTRLEYLDQTPKSEALDLSALLQRLVDGLQPQAEAKGVRLLLTDGATSVVAGDGHLLTRAVENLLDNALRHTPSGGVITVTHQTTPDGVTFTVADSGPGIAAHDLPHLFQPLYRGEQSRNRRSGGTGLGLTIARRILVAHGGDLTAANAAAGGALFTGSLPRLERLGHAP